MTQKFMHYLDDAHEVDIVRRYKDVAFDYLQPQAGQRILDVGCGPGTDARLLTERFGVRVVGLDANAFFLAEARQRSPESHLCMGDARELPFAPQAFDACRADRVLHALRQPKRVLEAMLCVTRPGGRLVVAEPDWGTLTIDTRYPQVNAHILDTLQRSMPSPRIGRQLYGMFKALGLQDVRVIPVTGLVLDFDIAQRFFHLDTLLEATINRGAISFLEGRAWLEASKFASRKELFLCSLTGFVVAGRKQ